MPARPTPKQLGVLGVVLLGAAAGVALAASGRGDVAVGLLLVLQVAVLAALVVLRNQVSDVRRATTPAAQAAAQSRLAERLAEQVRAADARHDEVVALLSGATTSLAGLAEVAARHVDEVGRIEELDATFRQEVRQGALQVPVDTWSLLNLLRLVDVTAEFPPAGGWAATPQTLLALVSEVRSRSGDVLVVECGSGTSTVWLAAVMRQRGSGRVVSLEHEEEYAEATREALRRCDLQDWADVRTAPLVDLPLEERAYPWYDTAATRDLGDVDVLLVDGPPWRTGEQARYPAAPVLVPALAPGALVVLDDVGRQQEKSIANRWVDEVYAGRRLRRERRLDRSQTFRLVEQ